MYDLQYAHAIPSLQEAIARMRLHAEHHLLFASVAPLEMDAGSSLEGGEEGCGNGQAFVMGGLVWEVGAGRRMEEYAVMWIGQESAALTQLLLTFNTCKVRCATKPLDHWTADQVVVRVLTRCHCLSGWCSSVGMTLRSEWCMRTWAINRLCSGGGKVAASTCPPTRGQGLRA